MQVESIQLELNRFMERIETARLTLLLHTRDVEKREQDIQQALNRLLTPPEVSKGQSSLQQVMTLLNEEVMSGIREKVQYLKDMAERQSFVDQFDQSLVLMVFGTVNSGKSTLGNFLAGESFRSNGYAYGQRPAFYRYTDMLEQSVEQIEIESFREGRTETTSEIQHFTLEHGLTWVDTPGILSMTKANENLAKHYVELADLVIIVTSSSSPTKASELTDFTKLIKKGKEVVVLITKSDMTECDEVDGQIVNVLQPKSEVNRRLQETYTKEQLELANPEGWSGAEVKSISIKLADEALAGKDGEQFEASRIQDVFELIGEKLSTDALRLKYERPRQALNRWIDELQTGNDFITGLNPLIHRLDEKRVALQTKYDEFNPVSERLRDEAFRAGSLEMDEWILRLSDDGAKEEEILNRMHELESALAHTLSLQIGEALFHILEEHGQTMQFKEGVALDVKIEQVFKEIDTIEYSLKNRRRDPRGVMEHIGSFLFKKEYTESVISETKTTKKVVVGSNVKEQLEHARQQMLAHLITQVEHQLRQIQQDVLGGSIALLEQTIQHINQTKKELHMIGQKEMEHYDNIHA